MKFDMMDNFDVYMEILNFVVGIAFGTLGSHIFQHFMIS
jgi:hypothetical protein